MRNVYNLTSMEHHWNFHLQIYQKGLQRIEDWCPQSLSSWVFHPVEHRYTSSQLQVHRHAERTLLQQFPNGIKQFDT